MKQNQESNLKRWLWLPLGAIGLVVLWLGWRPLLDLWFFVSNREAVTIYFQNVGVWGPLLLVSILSFNVVLAVIPSHIFLITSGYLYGFSYGLLFNMIASVGTSQLVFVLIQRTGRPLVDRFAPAHILERWRHVAERQGFIFFLFFFWFPIIPSNVMNFIAGLSPISFWAFLAANFLGRLPGIALITLIGSHGVTLSSTQWIVIAGVGGILFVAGRYATKKVERYFSKPSY